jgi:hypothetical protein
MPYLELLPVDKTDLSKPFIYIPSGTQLPSSSFFLSTEETNFINLQLKNGATVAELISPQKKVFVLSPAKGNSPEEILEKYRRAGTVVAGKLNALKQTEVTIGVEQDTTFSTCPGRRIGLE